MVSFEQDKFIADIEVYPNYWLFAWERLDGTRGAWACFNGNHYWDNAKAARALLDAFFAGKSWFIGFNNRKYDYPILQYAVRAADYPDFNTIIYKASCELIANEGYWARVRSDNVIIADCLAACPPFVSLKDMEGRLKLKRLSELPYAPDRRLTAREAKAVADYCRNSDIAATAALFAELKSAFEARVGLANTIQGCGNALCLTDAQIAEAMLTCSPAGVSSVCAAGGFAECAADAAGVPVYKAPPLFDAFKRDGFPLAASVIRRHEAGDKDMTKTGRRLSFFTQNLSNGLKLIYGSGGLHSAEKNLYRERRDNYRIFDVDVASFYPSILINFQVLGDKTPLYAEFKRQRLALKQAGDPMQAVYKIALNGTFGKMGSKFSKLYRFGAVEFVCKTGQLILTVLIERLSACGAEILSVNTDGITFGCSPDIEQYARHEVSVFEEYFKLEMEWSEYEKLLHVNVNNYWAVDTDGKLKTKGVGTPTGLRASPAFDISGHAVGEFLKTGAPVSDTIRCCRDLHMFTAARKSTKGAIMQGDVYIGRYARFYKTTASVPPLTVKGNRIANGADCRVVNIMPEGQFPDDIDYGFYEKRADDFLAGMNNEVKHV